MAKYWITWMKVRMRMNMEMMNMEGMRSWSVVATLLGTLARRYTDRTRVGSAA